MRLRKGDKVEVMNKTEAPVSWRVAEILSGNGHTYRVQYDPYPGMASEQMVETVSRKFVRPCPPLVQGIDNCIDGDIVEVFYEYAWKIAAILKSSQGGEDVTASKPSTSNQKMRFPIPQLNARAKKQLQRNSVNVQDEAPCWESHMISSRPLKRMSHTVPLSLNHIMDTSKNSEIDACSVGSCSVTDQSPNNFFVPFISLACQETDTLCSDAESCYGSGSERKSSSLPLKEEVAVSIRRLELRAYRRTLEALYASGPLSWEQEALLTNLRIMLHISNDEHLMELKHLISAKTAINVR
ncbi:hypothetical protein Sango_2230300 [Sesamum angolense]|uniref:ENT domain-containing protein n=1 Tax=Sesamum angolense TaxID=2727404 RepID=A0AAE1W8Y8_9LAMI|nr:hypothetical protein Sango_2230300 [Sesamum angolense]